ncbi:DUF2271 domain-containing protein [Sphingomonas sp.]|uniref:DUF2271 domain-containing protein n=1 Tax=Sphingomonas sp. TaxID=28214 RepID=UPI001B0F379C|nr:DUF2271 domain-containing protein [Sphingomonas sp.]MBO9713329.1 DUF2271 domain-containing protein [Sphingomonas sp.]
MEFRLTGLTIAAIGGGLIPAAASAQTIDLTVSLPQLSVAEYHRPYVAVWIEKEGAAPRTLSVWYDVNKRNNAGTRWLRDVRMWWRATGRAGTYPADGISSATRAPGTHKLSFTAGRGGMPALTPGSYTLVIEAARESGGREVVRLPFAWNGSKAVSASAKGQSELGAVTLNAHR